ncbi:MAG: carotenoid 1,2-hydratase [Henriciella sp.]
MQSTQFVSNAQRTKNLGQQVISAPTSPFGFQFDYTPPSGGYAWWYVDGISEDGQNAIVIIIFVGSVFSPYYAWGGWHAPDNHCAINVALYGPPQRWSMTERGRKSTIRARQTYQTGKSSVSFDGDQLIIDVDEICAPLPRRLRGQVKVNLPYRMQDAFQLDHNARHFWSPACPHAEVYAEFEKPGLSWRGHGYVDSNYGLEPIQKGFDYWDWSRTPLKSGDTMIRYVTDPAKAPQRDLHLLIDRQGQTREVSGDPSLDLSPTGIWRIKRRAGSLGQHRPRIHQTLEDTPFYSRSILKYEGGVSGLATHETFSGKRLRSPIVKALLPFRMPRLPG